MRVGVQKLERKEAVSLLRHLIEQQIIQTSLVSIEKNKGGGFELFLKVDCELLRLKQFLAEKNLAIREERGYCVIYRP